MYLIDTSVWIDSLRQVKNPAVRFFHGLLDADAPFGITGVIYQEILQGARHQADFDRLHNYLSTLPFYHPFDLVESFAEAASLYRHCRAKGLTIRSSSDCLIAQIAIERGLVLLHNDRDYVSIAKIVPRLKLAP